MSYLLAEKLWKMVKCCWGWLLGLWSWLGVKWTLVRGRRGHHAVSTEDGTATGDSTPPSSGTAPASSATPSSTNSPHIGVFTSPVLEAGADPVLKAKQQWSDILLNV